MSDQTPEARLAAALAKVPYQHPRLGTSELARSAPASVVVTRDEHIARSILAADLALAEKVRRLCEYDFRLIVRDRAVSLGLHRPQVGQRSPSRHRGGHAR